jgi:transposase InsO family protein
MRDRLELEEGFIISKERTRRLMRLEGLVSLRPKRYKATTDSNHDDPIAPNVLNRNFTTDAPNKVWVGDITYIYTHEGWLYLAVLIDLFSRKVVGWSMSSSLDRRLCLNSLEMAVRQRRPEPGLLHHSDRGCQYTSGDYQRALEGIGAICSMSRKGNCWDNAVAESFFATLKAEALYQQTFATRKEAIAVIFEYIESYYNRSRLHSTINNMTPVAFEQRSEARAKAA